MTTRSERTVDMSYRLVCARQLARQLRDAKSDHDWTLKECRYLFELCEVLRVDGPADPPREPR